ncbi:MAG: DUF3850 domain-containing protein [Clostridia bacterium]|nr:DUF3850 domain-containing protein [Clostridia bacterium]
MKHAMKIKEIYFNKTKSGEKVYKIRLNDEKRRLININDTIVLTKEPNLDKKNRSKSDGINLF